MYWDMESLWAWLGYCASIVFLEDFQERDEVGVF